MATAGEFQGRSLAFVRMMLHQRARFSTAREAAEQSDLHSGKAPVGACIWYRGGHYGDVGLSLGEGLALRLDIAGVPVVVPVSLTAPDYLGWSADIGDAPEGEVED